MVLRLRIVVKHLLQHHLGCAIAYLAPGHMAVYNIDNGMIHPAAVYLVNDDFTVFAELRGNAVSNLLQCFQSFCLHSPAFPQRHSRAAPHII